MPNPSDKESNCEMCGREKKLTFHHLIPKSTHKNKWFRKNFAIEDMRTRGLDLCRQCHSKIHQVHDEKTLGRQYNTLTALMEDPEIRKFVEWVKKR